MAWVETSRRSTPDRQTIQRGGRTQSIWSSIWGYGRPLQWTRGYEHAVNGLWGVGTHVRRGSGEQGGWPGIGSRARRRCNMEGVGMWEFPFQIRAWRSSSRVFYIMEIKLGKWSSLFCRSFLLRNLKFPNIKFSKRNSRLDSPSSYGSCRVRGETRRSSILRWVLCFELLIML